MKKEVREIRSSAPGLPVLAVFRVEYELRTNPWASVTLFLQAEEEGNLTCIVPEFIAEHIEVFGEELGSTWGFVPEKDDAPPMKKCRYRRKSIEARSWRELHQQVEELIDRATKALAEAAARRRELVANHPEDTEIHVLL